MAESKDLPECLSMVNSAEALPEHIKAALPDLWANILERSIFFVVEDQESAAQCGSIRAFGISVVTNQDFANSLFSDPNGSLAGRFYDSLLTGQTVLLNESEIGESHAREGVDVAVLHFQSVDRAAPGLPQLDVLRHGMASFLAGHGGFRLRNLLFDAHALPAVEILSQAGFRLVHPAAGPPYLMVKQSIATQPGLDPLSQLFFTPAPRIFFSSAERRLLERALHGQKDSEIARSLRISEDTVKKTWENVFSRAAREFPAIFQTRSANEGVRGPGKRTRLLDYIREHPEELRPWKRPEV